MSDISRAGSDLIYELEDRPPFHQSIIGAITHLLAIFVPMVTPALIVGTALQLSTETTAYLVSMAMIASGIGTGCRSIAMAWSVPAYSRFSRSTFRLLR